MKILKILDNAFSIFVPITIFLISIGFLFSPSKKDWDINIWLFFPESIYDRELKALFLLPLLVFTLSMLFKSINSYLIYRSSTSISILCIVSFGFSIVAISGLLIFQRVDFFFLNVFSIGFYIVFLWINQEETEPEVRSILTRIYRFFERNIGIIFIATMLYTSMFIAIMTDAGFQIASADKNAIALQLKKLYEDQKSVRSNQAPCFGDRITVNYGIGYQKIFLSQEYDTKCALLSLIKDLVDNPVSQKNTRPLYAQFDIDEFTQHENYDADVVIAYNIMRFISFVSEDFEEYNKEIGLFFQNAEINGRICQDFIGGQIYCLVREK